MKRAPFIALAALALALLATRQHAAPPPAHSISVYFSPKGGCTDAVVSEVNAAKQSIDVQAYSFTSPKIARAVADAQQRGVKVRVILDKSNRTDNYSAATYLFNHGITAMACTCRLATRVISTAAISTGLGRHFG